MLTIPNGFHPKSNVDRLYPSRSEDSTALIAVQDTVETVIVGLGNYVVNCKERFLDAASTIEEDEDRNTK